MITDKGNALPVKPDPKRNWIDPKDSECLHEEDFREKAEHEASGINELLLEIAHCPNFNAEKDNPCKTIVQTQPEEDYQVPEPWSGDLENAPILFLSSNPSISMREKCPRNSWADDKIIDFFAHRFGGGREGWTKDGKYTLLDDGTYKLNWVRYWTAVRRRSAELLGNDVQPGIDYVVSEVVHCKSHNEVGVGGASQECSRRYLRRMVEQSGARVIVCLGDFARCAVCQIFNISKGINVSEPIKIGNRLRYFAFLPHPNARKTRSFSKCFSYAELEHLRSCLDND